MTEIASPYTKSQPGTLSICQLSILYNLNILRRSRQLPYACNIRVSKRHVSHRAKGHVRDIDIPIYTDGPRNSSTWNSEDSKDGEVTAGLLPFLYTTSRVPYIFACLPTIDPIPPHIKIRMSIYVHAFVSSRLTLTASQPHTSNEAVRVGAAPAPSPATPVAPAPTPTLGLPRTADALDATADALGRAADSLDSTADALGRAVERIADALSTPVSVLLGRASTSVAEERTADVLATPVEVLSTGAAETVLLPLPLCPSCASVPFPVAALPVTSVRSFWKSGVPRPVTYTGRHQNQLLVH
ncbi:hypothetical protein C8Q76DRAFT_410490 [Earliella scabrosa]|nr:hypothetical protein C8Q76DRAFT_410490 [Earliella scabrosa]